MVTSVLMLLVGALGFQQEDNVLILDDSDFELALSTYKQLLVEFHAPWCAHCKYMAPQYQKAANKLKDHDPPVHLAKLDATSSTQVADKYKIKAYPTLIFFVDEEPHEYTGGRTEESIYNWVAKKINPAASVVKSLGELDSYLQKTPLTFVLFGDNESKEKYLFEHVVKDLEGNYYVFCPSQEAAESYGVKKPGLVAFKHYDDLRVDFEGHFGESEIERFIQHQQVPWVLPFEDKAINHVFGKQNPCLFLFMQEEDFQKYQELLKNLSGVVKGHILVSYGDLSTAQNQRLADFLGVLPSQMPMAFIIDSHFNKHLTFEVSQSGLTEFYSKWVEGTLPVYYKSQEVPEQEYEEGVRILVGKNFKQVVEQKNQDVMVYFHAPWCGHCKKLEPEYSRVAEYFREVNTVTVAKIDSASNEAPDHSVNSFPHLVFFPANNKSGVVYEGPRNAQSIIDFIKQNSALPLRSGNYKMDL